MWFKICDRFHDHRKARDLDLAAVGLWTKAGSWCGQNGGDGFVPESVPRRWTSSWRRLAGLLVERGLWEPCERDGEPGWVFHDWDEYNPRDDEVSIPVDRLRWRRKKQLHKMRDLCEQIVTRDRSQCRYCSLRVNWNDRKGPKGGTYDHVDPDGKNTLENVVVACRRCNGRKKDRTPEEANMPLLPVPGPYEPSTDLAPGESDKSGSDQVPSGEIPQGGTGLVGNRIGARSESQVAAILNGNGHG